MVLLNWSCSLVPGLLKDQGWGNLLMEVTSEGRGKSELSASGRIQPARPEPLNCPPSPRFCWLTRFLDLILLKSLNHLLILPLLSRWTCLLLKRQNKSHQLKCTPKCHHTRHSTHIKPHLLVFPSVSGKRRAPPSKFIHPVVCVCGGGVSYLSASSETQRISILCFILDISLPRELFSGSCWNALSQSQTTWPGDFKDGTWALCAWCHHLQKEDTSFHLMYLVWRLKELVHRKHS